MVEGVSSATITMVHEGKIDVAFVLGVAHPHDCHARRLRRCDVGRDTLMHKVAIGEGVTLTTAAASHWPFPGIAFRTLIDELEPARFSAVWSPHNRNPALKNLLDIANEMIRSARTPKIRKS